MYNATARMPDTVVSRVVALSLPGHRLAGLRGTLEPSALADAIAELKRLPHLITEVLEQSEEPLSAIVEENSRAEFFLYIGRHVGLPAALEGALKLKEISYIATDAYAAGEMKHGP